MLHELGLDLSATCDAEGFGSAIFYSVFLGRVECLEVCNNRLFFSSQRCQRKVACNNNGKLVVSSSRAPKLPVD